MRILFKKYQGTGNDFIMIHSVDLVGELAIDKIKSLCDRRFGVGGDGLIIVAPHVSLDFEMRYYNSDGSRSFCGNGARCAVKFAHSLGYFDHQCRFLAIDGVHEASLIENGDVSLRMMDVPQYDCNELGHYIINTGSPHYIRFVNNLEELNIVEYGKEIRYSSTFTEKGINVNIAQNTDDSIRMLTYERGVEDETLSCGTGATAVGLAFRKKKGLEGEIETIIHVKGGELAVKSNENENGFYNVFLKGPAALVYEGKIEL